MRKSEQLVDSDMDIQITQEDNHLDSSSLHFSSHQPLSIMDTNISNSFPIHMFSSSTLPHQHYLGCHNIPSATVITAAAATVTTTTTTTSSSDVVVKKKAVLLDERSVC